MFVLYLSWKGFHLFIYFIPGLIFHSEGTVCSSGGIISDRPWTRRPLLVSLALILLSPLAAFSQAVRLSRLGPGINFAQPENSF